jgi:hypothetical protein
VSPWQFAPPVRQCVDAHDVRLVVSPCRHDDDMPAVQLAILGGYSVHVPPGDTAELVWQIMRAASDDPWSMLNEVVACSIRDA